MKPLSSNSLFIGKVAKYLERIDSTNAFANNLLAKSNPIEGTVIYTDDQYAGRGQIGSKWESHIGKNIIMSVILFPKFLPIQNQFLLNQVVALAIYDLLKPFKFKSGHLAIKWPNDIYIGTKKIGGVLIENKLRGTSINATIIGIGLNINQREFAKDLPNPTALYLETGEEHALDVLLEGLCLSLERRYLQLKAGNESVLYKDYVHQLYGYEEWRFFTVVATGEELYGKIIGVAATGVIQIMTKDNILEFAFKEIQFIH